MRALTFVLACLFLVIPCKAEIIIVDPNGSADFDNIQGAINYSWHGDTVIVRPGTYNENVFFNSRAITLTSTDPNDPNVVESTIINVSSGYSVTFDFAEGSNSILTGFTIRDGILCYDSSPTITKNIIKDCSIYGIEGQYGASPVILANTIKSNDNRGIFQCDGPIISNIISDNRGGIAYCDGMISYNIITNNSIASGSGAGLYDCDGTITNNTISNNSQTYDESSGLGGGGLSGCDGEIIDNTITSNDAGRNGGALFQCAGNISSNIIVSNLAAGSYGGYGGALGHCTGGTIRNNIIAGNRCGTYGGGLYYCGGSIHNNTIVGNVANDYGGALYDCCVSVQTSVQNNIIAFNEASSIGGIYGFCNNAYNTLWMNEGGNFGSRATAGTGDICVEPLFALDGYWSGDTWADGDYHLKSAAGRWDANSESWVQDDVNSLCIDAGDPNSDWTAELWPHGKRINMGAYGGTPQASMSVLTVGNRADLNNDDIVDLRDFACLAACWQTQEVLLREDLNRDGYVGIFDLKDFVDNWLWEQ